MVKNPPAGAGDIGLIPRSGRSSGEGNSNPLQCSCLENPIQSLGSQRVMTVTRQQQQIKAQVYKLRNKNK